jgi:hydroxymethylpyrimidine pyrophosphatase-like HAD family hydrolase
VEAGFSCWVCGSNGCRVLDAPFGRLLEEHALTPEAALACVDLLAAWRMPVTAFVGDEVVIMRAPVSSPLQEAWFEGLPGSDGGNAMEGVDALREAASRGIHKMLVFEAPGSGKLPNLTVALRALPGVDITSSWVNNIEIMPTGVHKGATLAALAARLGVPREQVMAIGDEANDREMLAWAGCSVAMGNAQPEIKALCRFVTEDNAHNGVAVAIRRWVGL